MATFKVLLTDHPWRGTDPESAILARVDAELVDAPDGSEATLSRLAAECDAIATCWAKVTEKVIRGSPRCRIVARCGIGLDNISVATATELGIPVTNVPDYCIEEVADHALALLLALTRNIGFLHQRTKQGEYEPFSGIPMHRLCGRRLGLVGFGRIARAVRERALPLGLEVVASSPSGNDYGTGCKMLSLDELLRTADIVSLHPPLTSETRHMLDAAAFAIMKPGVFVINTSRGGLIDPQSLHAAILDGRVAGAGLDVFEPEPPDLDAPLYRDERVIATPHAAFISEESVAELRRRVFEQIVARLSGQTPENVVNPEVLDAN